MFNWFKKNKKKRTKSPFQLENLVELLQDGICIANLSGELIYLNKACYDLLKIDRLEEISLINFFDKFCKDDNSCQFLQKKLNTIGKLQNFEMKLYPMSGDAIDVILAANIIVDFNQKEIGALFLIKDISEFKKMQAQLLQTQKLESIGLMASGIAHDFNNILAAIIPNAELIKYSLDRLNENYNRADIIIKSANRATEIAQRLLTFTRQSGEISGELADLNKVVLESTELLEISMPKTISMDVDYNASLPLVKGSGSQIEQILLNLVINSFDAMPQGGEVSIRMDVATVNSQHPIDSLPHGDYAMLTVSDTGAGIPKALLEKVFDPFFTTKEVGKGTGLGLSIVYGIVKSLKGYVAIDSVPGEGTTFKIYLPVEGKVVLPEEETEKMDEFGGLGKAFLLVDDEDFVVSILSDILSHLGHSVIKKNSGPAALEYFNNHWQEIDFMVVDLRMPGMDGQKTAEKMLEVNPDAQIIFTSGLNDLEVADELKDGIGFLKKPYSINSVKKSLAQLIQNDVE